MKRYERGTPRGFSHENMLLGSRRTRLRQKRQARQEHQEEISDFDFLCGLGDLRAI
jgi:hypothetical protein